MLRRAVWFASKRLRRICCVCSKQNRIIFRRGVYLAENTSQTASVESVRKMRTDYARSRLQKIAAKRRRRFAAAGAAAALLAAAVFLPMHTQALSAQKAYVLDAVSGRVLFEKNPDRQSLIASTTKIMTALVVCEKCNVLDRMRIPKEAVGIEGSSMYLQEGEVLTIQELLYGLMLRSGNDAAVALAIYCGGTVEGFAELMNDKARILGLKNTHFVNPNGLDAPGHYSTARDLAVLAAYAMENPVFRQTVSTKTIKVGERYLTNHNKLLWRVEGADGVKTGYTKAAGRILVSSATRDDRRIIAVTIEDGDDWNDHTRLMNEGFSRYQVAQVVSMGDVLGTVEVLVEHNSELYNAEIRG